MLLYLIYHYLRYNRKTTAHRAPGLTCTNDNLKPEIYTEIRIISVQDFCGSYSSVSTAPKCTFLHTVFDKICYDKPIVFLFLIEDILLC